MILKKIFFVFLLILTVDGISFSQEKFEREYRVAPSEVPEKSLQIVKNWDFKNRVKWYAEESNEGKTFEAKVKHEKYKYSIEFSDNGNLIDVEKEVAFSELEENIQKKIKNNLRNKYRKYKFRKTQIQYKGIPSDLKNIFLKQPTNHINTRLFYEIVIKAKKDKMYSLYELLVDDNGDLLKELKFKASSFVNLEF